MLILTIVQLDITLENFFFSFYFVYTSACNFVFAFMRVITLKVTVSVCEDGIKLNYFRSILNQKEPYTNYAENKKKAKDIAIMQNNKEQDQVREQNEPQGDHNGKNGRNYVPRPFIQPYNPFILLE